MKRAAVSLMRSAGRWVRAATAVCGNWMMSTRMGSILLWGRGRQRCQLAQSALPELAGRQPNVCLKARLKDSPCWEAGIEGDIGHLVQRQYQPVKRPRFSRSSWM